MDVYNGDLRLKYLIWILFLMFVSSECLSSDLTDIPIRTSNKVVIGAFRKVRVRNDWAEVYFTARHVVSSIKKQELENSLAKAGLSFDNYHLFSFSTSAPLDVVALVLKADVDKFRDQGSGKLTSEFRVYSYVIDELKCSVNRHIGVLKRFQG